jgi:hypothetical protein
MCGRTPKDIAFKSAGTPLAYNTNYMCIGKLKGSKAPSTFNVESLYVAKS